MHTYFFTFSQLLLSCPFVVYITGHVLLHQALLDVRPLFLRGHNLIMALSMQVRFAHSSGAEGNDDSSLATGKASFAGQASSEKPDKVCPGRLV